MESWIAGVSDSDDAKPESSESTEGALNPIIKPGGKYSYLRISCYFDVNYVKHNLHQSGGKLLTLDFCPLKKKPMMINAPRLKYQESLSVRFIVPQNFQRI